MGRISHGSSEQLEEAFLHQPVSSLPESADADPQNTVWSHTFAGRSNGLFSGGSETEAGRRGAFPVFPAKGPENEVDEILGKPVPLGSGRSAEQIEAVSE